MIPLMSFIFWLFLAHTVVFSSLVSSQSSHDLVTSLAPTLKCYFPGTTPSNPQEIVRMNVIVDSIDTLRHNLARQFNIPVTHLLLKYQDDEGDLVSVVENTSLEEVHHYGVRLPAALFINLNAHN